MTLPKSSTSGRFGRKWAWLFSRRTVARGLFAAACLLTLVAMFYAEENWRGKRAWQECRRDLETQGANFDWSARIPAAVPDDQNIFKAPGMTEWFVKLNRGTTYSNSLSEQASAVLECTKQGVFLAEVTTSPAGANVSTGEAEVVVTKRAATGPEFDTEELQAVGQLLQERLGPQEVHGPSVRSVQDPNLVFVASPTYHPAPFHVLLRTESSPTSSDVRALFESAAATVGARAQTQGGWEVEPNGASRFKVRLRAVSAVDAAQYLTCSDELLPALDQVRRAVDRPRARREGDYSNPWAVPIPNFVVLRQVAQLLAQRALCHLLLNEPEKALEEMTLLHTLHRLIEGTPTTLVAAMIDVAVRGLYSAVIADGLRLHAWREPQLTALQRQIQEVQLVPMLLGAIDTERAASCQALEATSASELRSIYMIGSKPGFWGRLGDPQYLLARWMPRGWIYQNMKAIALQDQSFLESTLTNHIVKPGLVEESSRRSLASLEGLSPYNVWARIAMPNFLKAFQTTVRNQATVSEAYLACGLERYRLMKNEYPDRLETLVPGFASEVPLDPIGGQPLKYHRLQPNQFVLYSIGWDGVDDNGNSGKNTAEGDWVWDESHP